MRQSYCITSLVLTALLAFTARGDDTASKEKTVPPVLNFTMKSLAGQDVKLADYQGKVILMVNTASKCGFTPQYKELEALYEKYKDKGLVILGFPANDFKHQEPGTDAEIATFCEKNYGVTFDMFSKIAVTGDEQAPLYRMLTNDAPETGPVKWNFEKFLISRDGKIVKRFRSAVKPSSDDVTGAIEAELGK